ncbi:MULTISPECIES: ureidoglycolate lyase [unclassified Bradyrhizobium]|uniref:ureidoglycolate lyase n=1 Tax=unclassified Bradyrhizobium TaxID=2631580 RepID=UPI0028E5EC0B|nr:MULTISPECIES: ureidoglycolate lyase [unclassified Bradyrhizobium]
MQTLTPQPLTKAAFAAFGDVVETDGAALIEINQGFARRCNGLAAIDVTSGAVPVNISLFEAKPRPRPIEIKLMERHPLGTQLFMPLQDRPWLVLVCADPHDATSYRAFTATGRQGVNYARNVWHHPLLVFDDASRFMVVDRMSPDNLEELWLDQPLLLSIP